MNITSTLSKNRKLTKGPRIPAWNVGTTKESMHASCQKVSCPFYDGGQFINPITGEEVDSDSIIKTEGTIDTPQTYHTEDGSPVIQLDSCFSIKGRPAHANTKIMTMPERHGADGLQTAMNESPRTARIVRGAVVGNASGTITESELESLDRNIRAHGFFHVLYDHGWKQHAWILRYAMASCNHLADIAKARESNAHGVTIVLPPELVQEYKGQTIHGYKMVHCPAEISDKGSCNSCGGSKGPLCDVQRDNGDRQLGVLFTQHGTRSWQRIRQAMIGNISHAILGNRSDRNRAWIEANPDQAMSAIESDQTIATPKTRSRWINFLTRSQPCDQ